MSKYLRRRRGLACQYRRLLRYMWHRGGHGIHSPFAFDLITRLVEERTPYYAFEDLWSHTRNFSDLIYTRREAELLFRLICHYHIRTVFTTASDISSTARLYLESAYSNIHIEPYEQHQGGGLSIPLGDLVLLLVESHLDDIVLESLPEGSVVFVLRAAISRGQGLLVRLHSNSHIGISVDLPGLFIGIISGKLNKRRYKAFL